MKSHTDLFYFTRELDKTEDTLKRVRSIKSKLVFYDNELDFDNIKQAEKCLTKLYNELNVLVKDESTKFTKEELKELSRLYQEESTQQGS